MTDSTYITSAQWRQMGMSSDDLIETIAANVCDAPFVGDVGWRRFKRVFGVMSYDRLVEVTNRVLDICSATGLYGDESKCEVAGIVATWNLNEGDKELAPLFPHRLTRHGRI